MNRRHLLKGLSAVVAGVGALVSTPVGLERTAEASEPAVVGIASDALALSRMWESLMCQQADHASALIGLVHQLQAQLGITQLRLQAARGELSPAQAEMVAMLKDVLDPAIHSVPPILTQEPPPGIAWMMPPRGSLSDSLRIMEAASKATRESDTLNDLSWPKTTVSYWNGMEWVEV